MLRFFKSSDGIAIKYIGFRKELQQIMIIFVIFPDLLNTRPNVTFTTPLSVTRQTHSPSWSRPVFSDHQRKTLEDRFQRQHYLNKRERYYLSLYLGLTEHQIKVWFQNRRVKWRHSQEGKKDRNTKLHRAKKTAEKN